MRSRTLETWMKGAPKEDKTLGNFIDKVIMKTHLNENGCLIWHGHVHLNGYPRVTYKGRSWFVHRLNWTIARGDIPKGMYLCHKCDNPLCINLDHLFAGTPNDNIQDMVKKDRHYRLHEFGVCRRGHEMTDENTYTRPNGYTNCRKCLQINKNKRKH